MGAFSCDMSLSDWRPMEVQSCLATKNLIKLHYLSA